MSRVHEWRKPEEVPPFDTWCLVQMYRGEYRVLQRVSPKHHKDEYWWGGDEKFLVYRPSDARRWVPLPDNMQGVFE